MDFDENASIAVKYGVFTLAYSQFLARLEDFERALSPATGFALEQVWAGVDDAVGKLLRQGQPASLEEAAQRVSSGLCYERDLMVDRVPELAPLYETLCDAIQAAAPTWDYGQDVERWHRLGRELARRFYATSPHAATRDRLAHEAVLRFEWTREARQAPFGYREDRLRAAKTPLVGTITVRFCFSDTRADGLVNYLTYPFYFMHEYVSHIYAVSTQSDIFSDGWLLFAAQRSLRRINARAQEPPLLPEQIDAIDAVLPQQGVARRGYTLARHFQAWADAITPNCFEQLTYYLAALSGVNGLSLTRFLWVLEQLLEDAQPRLRELLKQGGCRPESLLKAVNS
jgi:hypothetical protein